MATFPPTRAHLVGVVLFAVLCVVDVVAARDRPGIEGMVQPVDRTPLPSVTADCSKGWPACTLYSRGRDVVQCLDRMEAAMRAMDVAIAAPPLGDQWDESWLAVITRARWGRWEAVKRDCWGNQ